MPDVALKVAPLIRVLAQIRWPTMSSFALDDVADELGKRIGKEYPIKETGQEMGFLLTPSGVTQQAAGTLHRFQDAESQWTITFAATFVTLETTTYTTHEDFIPRLVTVARELREFLPLARWDRFGYRYTNRISDARDLEDLANLFDPAVVGTVGLQFADRLVHTVAESVYETADASLLVKSAYLPPGAAIEPTIPPLADSSWFLDLDAFAVGPSTAFSDADIESRAKALSESAHDFFRKVTTDAYRSRFVS